MLRSKLFLLEGVGAEDQIFALKREKYFEKKMLRIINALYINTIKILGLTIPIRS